MIKDSNYNKKEYNPYLLTEIQPKGGIKFDEKIIQKGDGYETVVSIYEYPTQVSEFWLERIIAIKDVIITIDIGTYEKGKVKSKIEKSLAELENRYYTDSSRVSRIEAQNTYQNLTSLVNDITQSNEIVKLVNVRYFISATTREQVEEKVKDVISELESIGYKSSIYVNEQQYEWQSLFTPYTEQEKFKNRRKGKAIPSVTLGAGYPFHFTSLDDPTGTFLGTTFTGGNVLFDIFTKTKKRMYYNGVVVGSMGSGKSTLLKKLVKDNAIQGQTIRILDIVGEFNGLVKSLGGKIVSLDGNDGIINPLQVLATITDDKTYEVDNRLSFMTHISKVSMMYKYLSQDCSSVESMEFEMLLNKFYKFWNIEVDKSTEYETRAYPILSDLLAFIKEELYSDLDKKIMKSSISDSRKIILEKIILTLDSTILNYGKLFDGYSDISSDLTNEQIISFELRNLSSFDSRIFNAQIFNILTILWNNSLVQGRKEMGYFNRKEKTIDECKKYMILIDEAHKIINSNNILAVEYLTNFEREARKYFGGLVFATQNIRDVAPNNLNDPIFEKIKTLFELTQYKFIMKQGSNALNILKNVFEGQISDNELNKIPYLEQGNCILSIDGLENILFNVEVTKEELSLFGGGA
ncbi:VirB4 family type IV secretion system protein [Terrisporobacter sp.]|uniref:VirB4 family type IV secretion system protein n=1 Tax=Terrisporobacter sp. TaxID=1965305 RepID=UPI002634ADDB|nr:ATP-binding protein [Terrisporobacter sp.]